MADWSDLQAKPAIYREPIFRNSFIFLQDPGLDGLRPTIVEKPRKVTLSGGRISAILRFVVG